MHREAPILPHAVRRDIAILICVKLLALGLIYLLLFEPYEQAAPTPGQIAARIFTAGAH